MNRQSSGRQIKHEVEIKADTTYNFNKIHLADPGHEMQPLEHAVQVLGSILTVAGLGAVHHESLSLVSLDLDLIGHIEAPDVCGVVWCGVVWYAVLCCAVLCL